MEKLIIIDGNSLMNRAFYALPPLTAKDGRHTNAVFGFCNILFKIIDEAKPTNLIVAFDMGKPTFRHKMYAEYKGTRSKMPEELAEQMPLIQEVLAKMNIKILQQEGIEADDIIGTIAKRFDKHTIIVTGDKDCLQLVDDSTEVWLTRKGISEIDILNIDNFKEKMNIIPSQIIDLKAMMGDSSDNIPGIAGVGEKTAHEFLSKFGTLEGLYENIDTLTGAKERKVRENKELAFLSKELATINTQCDIECNLDEAQLSVPFSMQTKKMFSDLQFTSLLKREHFFESKIEEELPTAEQVHLISALEIVDVLQKNKDCKQIALIPVNNELHFAFNTEKNYICDEIHFSYFIDIITNSNITKILYNGKQIHRHYFPNIENFESFFDILIASHLIDGATKDPKKIDDNLYEYNVKNGYAVALISAYEVLQNKLVETNMLKIYNEIELPLEKILFDMEQNGLKVEQNILKEIADKYKESLKEIERKIYEQAGEEFNINSPKQLGDILFDKLAIPTEKNNKRSTSFEVLEKIEDRHPILPLIMRYRKLGKLVNTYLDGFVKFIDKDSLVHTEYEQTMTATGRLSSINPNLQNIPVKDEDGKYLRKMFIPKSDDNIFIGADYNQVELRLLAHFSQDKILLDAFNSNKDVHTTTASEIFDVDFEEVTPEMRRTAKIVNFGIIYGMSDYGLAQTLKISSKTAKMYIEKYFETYKQVKEYMNNVIENAKKDGFVSTMLGRKRFIPELHSSNKLTVKFGERVAMNTPLQGTGSEIIKMAMIEVYNKFKSFNLKAKLILQIHDELIVECPQNEAEQVKQILIETMENIVQLRVPLPISLNTGKSWYDI